MQKHFFSKFKKNNLNITLNTFVNINNNIYSLQSINFLSINKQHKPKVLTKNFTAKKYFYVL